MNTRTNTYENAQRLRYEALSVFATELNKCLDYDALCGVLSSQVKFILDSYVLRVYYQHEETQLSCEVFRGECNIRKGRDVSLAFELDTLHRGLPMSFDSEQIRCNPLFQGTIFNQDKIVTVFTLPVTYAPNHLICVSMASREVQHWLELDFRFLKLISELLSNKFFQLKLLENIRVQNQELEAKNLQITRFNHTLTETVAERTRELTEANEDLTTLFYRTSHDFRAPLANIMGLANLAPMMSEDPEILDLFDKCSTVASSMDGMLRKLNLLTHTFKQPHEIIDFDRLVADLRQTNNERLASCNGSISFVIDEGFQSGYKSDLKILTTVLECLTDNSLIFNEGDLSINIHVFEAGTEVCIQFTDNGDGIAPRMMPQVFDMYYRGSSKSVGHGLGLYVAKRLLRLLKAEISVSSVEKEFTSFLIKLPL